MGNAIRRTNIKMAKRTLAPFHRAEANELAATSLTGQAFARQKFFWTPTIQKVKPDLAFLEYLEGLKYQQKANIYERITPEEDIRQLVEAFIQEAFTKEELASFSLQKNMKFEPSKSSLMHGNVDYLIHNSAQNRYLGIFIGQKSHASNEDGAFFRLGEYTPEAFFDYMIKNYKMDTNLMVLKTNGHQWQLFGIDEEFRVKPTKVVENVETGLLFDDPEAIQAALGMIRHPLIRFKNELLLDELLQYYDLIDRTGEPADQSSVKHLKK